MKSGAKIQLFLKKCWHNHTLFYEKSRNFALSVANSVSERYGAETTNRK